MNIYNSYHDRALRTNNSSISSLSEHSSLPSIRGITNDCERNLFDLERSPTKLRSSFHQIRRFSGINNNNPAHNSYYFKLDDNDDDDDVDNDDIFVRSDKTSIVNTIKVSTVSNNNICNTIKSSTSLPRIIGSETASTKKKSQTDGTKKSTKDYDVSSDWYRNNTTKKMTSSSSPKKLKNFLKPNKRINMQKNVDDQTFCIDEATVTTANTVSTSRSYKPKNTNKSQHSYKCYVYTVNDKNNNNTNSKEEDFFEERSNSSNSETNSCISGFNNINIPQFYY